MKTKFLKIYLPFLATSLGLLVLYTFLHWLIIIKLDLIPTTDIIVTIVGPMVISGLAVLILLRKKLKWLKLPDRAPELFYVMGWLFIFTPITICQHYLDIKCGEISRIGKPSMIEYKNQTLYYSIDSAQTLNKYGGLWITRNITSKSGDNIEIACFFTSPLIDQIPSGDIFSIEFNRWIGVKFSKEFSKRDFDNDAELKAAIDTFINESINRFQTYRFSTSYLHNLKHDDFRSEFTNSIDKSILSYSRKNLIILKEENGTYESRIGNTLYWLIGTLIASNIIFFLLLLIPKLNTEQKMKHSPKKKAKMNQEYREIMQLFIPSAKFWATPIIIDLNILIFLVMAFSGVSIFNPQGGELIAWGANFKPLTADGQWWRLLSSVFLHAGVVHLLYNMVALLFIGLFLETAIGSRKFMVVYLISGLIASINSMLFHDATVSIGASGAIFGMYGLMASLMLIKYLDKALTKTLMVSVAAFIGINLLVGLVGFVDMAAHLGGLVAGLTIGITYFPLRKYLDEKRESFPTPK